MLNFYRGYFCPFDRYTANGIQVCYMLCTRLWGKARTMAHLPQVSIKPICCPCSDLCYLFFCNRQCRLFVFIASPHTISGASQDLSARDIHSPYGSRAAMGWVKDSLRKPNMKRPYTSVTNCQGLRFARFETKLYGHFIGKFGPASHRRSTAHPFLL